MAWKRSVACCSSATRDAIRSWLGLGLGLGLRLGLGLGVGVGVGLGLGLVLGLDVERGHRSLVVVAEGAVG